MPNKRKCPMCNLLITKANQVYCSPVCAQKARRIRQHHYELKPNRNRGKTPTKTNTNKQSSKNNPSPSETTVSEADAPLCFNSSHRRVETPNKLDSGGALNSQQGYFEKKKPKVPLSKDDKFIKFYEETFDDPYILIEMRGER